MAVDFPRQPVPARLLDASEYKRIFDAAPALLLILAPDEGFTVLDASDAYLRATNTRRGDVVGRPILDQFADGAADLRASLMRVVDNRAADAMPVQRYELRCPGGGFEERYWSATSSPVFTEGRQVLCVIHRVEDVTKLLGAQAPLEIAKARHNVAEALREAERRKDEFIATLSHELRNPLAPLRNGLSLLQMTARADAATAAVHEMMERQVNQLVRLVDDLLEMSRITRGVLALRRERVELASVIRNAVETSEPLIREAGHHLEVKLPRNLLWLEGDPVRLAQILANLLNNAARFTESGGRITLVAEESGGAAMISVRDNGIGFSPDAGDRLFEMFTKSDRSRGLGLGLGLARRLAQMHGGSVEGRSAGEGHGAEFIVRLPLASEEAQAAQREGHPGTEETIACRVLVADDNRDAAESLAELMRDMGADVFLAYDGAQAVEMARSLRPELVLLDIGMPKLDGYQAAQRIRGEAGERRLRLVALTGWGQDEDRRRAREAGFDEHMVKPAQLESLRELLVSVTRQNEQEHRPRPEGERWSSNEKPSSPGEQAGDSSPSVQ